MTMRRWAWVGTVALVGVPSTALSQTDMGETERAWESARQVQRALRVATASGLLLTAGLGVVAGINEPTWFGDGRCPNGSPVFGSYGCDGLSALHGAAGVGTFALYTADTTIELMGIAREPGDHPTPLENALRYTHLALFIAQPLLGLTSAVPALIGLRGDDARSFSRSLRSIHMGVGVLLAGAYAGTLISEW